MCILFQDVHETAAGALWNLAFNPGSALRIVEDGGVPTLGRFCSLSKSTMARFMAALTLAYMFDGSLKISEFSSAPLPMKDKIQKPFLKKAVGGNAKK